MFGLRKPNGAANIGHRLTVLQRDFMQLQKDMRHLAEAGSDGIAQAIDTAEDAADRAVRTIGENLAPMRKTVRAQPLTSILITLSAGAIAGALLASGSSTGRSGQQKRLGR